AGGLVAGPGRGGGGAARAGGGQRLNPASLHKTNHGRFRGERWSSPFGPSSTRARSTTSRTARAAPGTSPTSQRQPRQDCARKGRGGASTRPRMPSARWAASRLGGSLAGSGHTVGPPSGTRGKGARSGSTNAPFASGRTGRAPIHPMYGSLPSNETISTV